MLMMFGKRRIKEVSKMIDKDEIWRKIINGLEIPDLEGNSSPPKEESILVTPKKKGQHFFVQKVTSEVYIYTDLEGEQFGETTFQDVTILGDMPSESLLKMLRRRQKQQDGKS
jgi:hypothetical protein